MTDKAWQKLKKFDFRKKPIKGYIMVCREYINSIPNATDYEIEQAEKKQDIYMRPDDNGFKFTEDMIAFKTAHPPIRRISIPYRHVKTTRIYDYN